MPPDTPEPQSRIADANNRSVIRRLLLARGLRAFADGYVSLLLPVYLVALGLGAFDVGLLATATLVGSGISTLLAGRYAGRFGLRRLLLCAAWIMVATGIGFATQSGFWPLLLIAAVGTLNPSSGDTSIFLPLEHALLSRSVSDKQRTAAFARYSLIGTLVAALGSLAAGFPDVAAMTFELPRLTVLKAMFGLYAVIGVVTALLYAGLTRDVASRRTSTVNDAPLMTSKPTVIRLAILFSLDSFGSGFILQSMVALWLYQRFELSVLTAGTVFFWTGVVSALSYPVAVVIARRFGLVNTMVFTHLPSSLLLIVIPFMPTLEWAVALLIVRAMLSQMDVPVRSSYVMAVVPPEERAAAASLTLTPKTFASALSPALAGMLLSMSSFGWPLLVAGGLKATYDLLLLRQFGRVRAPEEIDRER